MGFDEFVHIKNKSVTINYSIQHEEGCPKLPGGIYEFQEKKAYSIFLQDKITSQLVYVYPEQMDKSSKANPMVRNLANIDANSYIIWRSGVAEVTKKSTNREIMELRAATYDVLVDNVKVHEERLRHGGVYALVIGASNNGTTVTKLFEVIEPNSMSILWLVPQYVVMTLGEVMFSVTGLEFSYSQAPVTMKSVLQACWLLTVAFGNVIVVIVAELKFFDSQASEFFLFSGLMFVDMIIFMWVAYCYKPNNPLSPSKLQAETTNAMVRQQNSNFNQNYRPQQQSTTSGRVPRYTKKQQTD